MTTASEVVALVLVAIHRAQVANSLHAGEKNGQCYIYIYITPSHYYRCANLSEDFEIIKCLSNIYCGECKMKHILCYH